MDFRTEPAGIFARMLAIISLAMGLGDAARLLGVWGGAQSPLTALGASGFVLLTILATARLFAAVGLWIKVQWGAILFAGALALELLAHLFGTGVVAMTLYGFVFKLVTLLATIGLIAAARFLNQRHAAD